MVRIQRDNRYPPVRCLFGIVLCLGCSRQSLNNDFRHTHSNNTEILYNHHSQFISTEYADYYCFSAFPFFPIDSCFIYLFCPVLCSLAVVVAVARKQTCTQIIIIILLRKQQQQLQTKMQILLTLHVQFMCDVCLCVLLCVRFIVNSAL